MAGQRFDFIKTTAIPKGGDFKKDITFKNADGTVMDLTGCEAYARVKWATLESEKAIVEMTTIVDAVNGVVHLEVPMASMLKIPTGGKEHNELTRYHWDLYMKWADGTYEQILYGYFDVMPRATEIETYAP